MQYTDHHGNKYVFHVGTGLVYANGMVPRHGQKYPGFGDVGVVTAIPKERHAMTPNMPDVAVKFARCGMHTRGICYFWPPGSNVIKVAQALARLAKAQSKEARMLKLFVWERVFCDHSRGIAFALAETEDEARQMCIEQYSPIGRSQLKYAQQSLEGQPRVYQKDKIAFVVVGGG